MKKNTLFVLIGLLIVFSSCSKYDKLLKSTDYEKKYEKAIEYYENEDYYRAIQLFDNVLPMFRGTDKAEKAYYLYADAYFKQENYLLAAYHYKNFLSTFPQSDKQEEVAFMVAFCYYQDSPDYSLDVTNTLQAITELQLFANAYPNSERLEQCNQMIDKLRAKLEKKDYNQAMLYYKMEEYQAAVVCFKNLLKEYPGTANREEVMFLMFKSSYMLAMKSVEKKKNERLKAAVVHYKEFINKYPDNKFNKEAEKLSEELNQEVTKRNIL